MGLPVEMSGLKQVLNEVPEGSLVVVEGGLEVIKSVFVQYLCMTSKRQGRPTTYVTSRGREEVKRQIDHFMPEPQAIEVFEDRTPGQWRARMREGGLLVVDSFSYLMMDSPVPEVRAALEELQRGCRQTSSIVVLVLDQGLLDPRAALAASHLADAIVLFHTREGSEDIARFMRIPKWTDGHSIDTNINFTFIDKRFSVDLRQRVV
jgi:KaiC/GvpD/RAD55 family RecA-like ATPase